MEKIRLLYSSSDIQFRISRMAEEVADKLGVNSMGIEPLRPSINNSVVTLVPILRGSLFFASDLARELWRKRIDSEIEPLWLSHYNEDNKPTVITIKCSPGPMVDKTVIILDDVVETGKSFKVAKEVVSALGPNKIYLAALIDKSSDKFVDFSGFRSDLNKWVAGYGMDYKGYLRNRPNIVTIEEEK